MNARFSTAIVLALLAAAALVGVDAQILAPNFAGSSLTAPRSDWPTNGGDWYNRRYSPLHEIDRDNVASLKGVWRTRLRGSGFGPQYSGEAQPIVYDGVLYVVDAAPTTCSRSASTAARSSGRTRRISIPASDASAAAGRAAASALGDGKVFVGQLDGKLVALDQRDRRRRLVACKPSAGKKASRSRARRSTTTASSSRASRAPSTASAAASKRSTPTTASSSGRSTRFRAPARSATTRGRRTTRSGCTAARRCGRRRPSIPSSDSSTSRPAIRAPISTAPCAPATTCSRRRSSPSMREPASTAGTSSKCITTSGTTTRPSPVVLFDLEINGATRKGLAQAGKTGWVYILDRTNGTAARSASTSGRAAGAAPGDRGDAAVPARRRVRPAVDRHRARRLRARQRRQDLHAVLDRLRARRSRASAAARTGRRARTTPRPATSMSARPIAAGVFRAGRSRAERPADGERYIGGAFGAFQMPRFGVFAALDMRTNKLVWQQHWPERCYSGSVATAGGLVFVGRNDGRLTALDSATARSSGSSKPAPA